MSNISAKALVECNFNHPHKKNRTRWVTSRANLVLMYRKRHSSALIPPTAHLVINFAPATICPFLFSLQEFSKTTDSYLLLTSE
jgi:hypothetical protein